MKTYKISYKQHQQYHSTKEKAEKEASFAIVNIVADSELFSYNEYLELSKLNTLGNYTEVINKYNSFQKVKPKDKFNITEVDKPIYLLLSDNTSFIELIYKLVDMGTD